MNKGIIEYTYHPDKKIATLSLQEQNKRVENLS